VAHHWKNHLKLVRRGRSSFAACRGPAYCTGEGHDVSHAMQARSRPCSLWRSQGLQLGQDPDLVTNQNMGSNHLESSESCVELGAFRRLLRLDHILKNVDSSHSTAICQPQDPRNVSRPACMKSCGESEGKRKRPFGMIASRVAWRAAASFPKALSLKQPQIYGRSRHNLDSFMKR
jgi:hypothetical protein